MLKLHFKNNLHDDVPLDQVSISLGRDKSNAVVIDAPGISGFHAEIHCEKDRLYLIDLGSTNGCKVNGRRVTGKQELKAWDAILFDTLKAEVVDTESRSPTRATWAVIDEDLARLDTGPAGTQVRNAVGEWLLIGESGLKAGKQVPVAGKMVVGRGPVCDLTLQSSEVSTKHAELELIAGQLHLRDLNSTNGTFVNDRRVTEAVLRSGDIVKFDVQTFKVSRLGDDILKTAVRSAVDFGSNPSKTAVMDSVHEKESKAPTPVLTGLGGKRFTLKERSSVGRGDDNTIAIDDPTVSVEHARLSRGSEGWIVEDLGSTNGTFVNGKKITRFSLQPGDRVRFGKAEMTFELPGSTSSKGTQVMSSIGDESVTRTSTLSAHKAALPPWAYGVVGFFVVGLGFSVFLFRDSLGFGVPKQIHAELQAASIWSNELPTTVTGVKRSGPTTPAIADINGDKILDVVMGDGQGFLLALDGKTGKKIFDVHLKDKVLAPPATADISGNGIADVVVATNSGIVKVVNGEGKDLWSSSRDLSLGAVWNRPVLNDLNKDGVPDVVVPTQNKGLVGLDGARGWKLWDTREFTKGQVITTPASGDFNADGVMDYIYATDNQHLVAVSAQGDRVWRLWDVKTPGNVNYASPLFLDVGDRGLTVVLTDAGPVAYYADNGRQAWGIELRKRFFASPIGVDANGDGVPDVVAAAENGDIHTFDALTGDEIWSVSLGVDLKASPAAFDANDDGLPDLVILDNAGRMLILDMARGRPELTLQAAKPVMTSQGEKADGFIASPVMGDLTGDGLLEIVTASNEGRIKNYGLNRTVRKGKAIWPVFLGNDSHSFN